MRRSLAYIASSLGRGQVLAVPLCRRSVDWCALLSLAPTSYVACQTLSCRQYLLFLRGLDAPCCAWLGFWAPWSSPCACSYNAFQKFNCRINQREIGRIGMG